MILIQNLSDIQPFEPWEVKIDRSSQLGSPFYIKPGYPREKVLDMYAGYFYAMSRISPPFQNELKKLLDIYKLYGKIHLFCWCFPKQCHGETIKNYILENSNG